jgi:hypothetical protein
MLRQPDFHAATPHGERSYHATAGCSRREAKISPAGARWRLALTGLVANGSPHRLYTCGPAWPISGRRSAFRFKRPAT